jgi:hypothetical protein
MRVIFVFVVLLVAQSVRAQTYQEMVYLKNGSIIKCVVLEEIPGKTIKLQTADGSIFVYKMDEVERITKELKAPAPRTDPDDPFDVPDTTHYKKYAGYLKAGAAPTLGAYSGFTMLCLEFDNCIRVNSQSAIGIGFGYEQISGVEMIPLTFATHLGLGRAVSSGYIFANIGYEFTTSLSGIGLTYIVGVGYQNQSPESVGFTIDVGYKSIAGNGSPLTLARVAAGIVF